MGVNHYVDIRLRPDPEFSAPMLLSALFAKLHRALAFRVSKDIAVSFPDYRTTPPSLGRTLRVIGTRAALESLMAYDWMIGLRDHVSVGTIDAVPASAVKRWLRRVQAKSNPERLRRRQMKRHGLTAAEALARIPDAAEEKLNLPYVQLTSASTGQTFRLFLEMSESTTSSEPTPFNTYGLSTSAAIPWF
jgi:CRISPR-associated endonuclease Csy4